jgi:predicted O-methyltransferase YrrM
VDIIPTLDMKFDLVFIDADKENYNYFNIILPKNEQRGFLIMYCGWESVRTVTPERRKHQNTIGIQRFTEK